MGDAPVERVSHSQSSNQLASEARSLLPPQSYYHGTDALRETSFLEFQKEICLANVKDKERLLERGFIHKGIAFPVLMKIDQKYLPVFLTSAHSVWADVDLCDQVKIWLVPSESLDPKKGFVFSVEKTLNSPVKAIFGCNEEGPGTAHSLDFLALVLQSDKNEDGEEVTKFWKPGEQIAEGDEARVVTTFQNFDSDVPHLQVGVANRFPSSILQQGNVTSSKDEKSECALAEIPDSSRKRRRSTIEETEPEIFALSKIQCISGMGGECVHSKNKESTFLLKGSLYHPFVSPGASLATPLKSIGKFLQDNFADKLEDFCIDKVPDHWQISVNSDCSFVESYLLYTSTTGTELE